MMNEKEAVFKHCPKCNNFVNVDYFPKRKNLKRHPEGLFTICKKCLKKRNKNKNKRLKKPSPAIRPAKNRKKSSEVRHLEKFLLRKQVLSQYCNGLEPYCKKCGYSNIHALQIDHINNDGRDDRVKFGSGIVFYRHIIKSGYPEQYQVLCANCNRIRYHERAMRRFFGYECKMFPEQN